ncbi:MAG: glycosyl hydrolase family 8 [Planctomycetota bacterium]
MHRSLLALVLASLSLAACGGGGGGGSSSRPPAAADVARPFGSHTQAYAAGILPSHHPQRELDDAVRAYYDLWRAKYVESGCGADRYHVAMGRTDEMTVSEAHGYGMLICAFMAGHDADARTLFDGMHRYYLDHPSAHTPGLMAWCQDSACNDINGVDSAADGDLDIAYALLLADRQWGSGGGIDYRAAASTVLDAIAIGDVDPDHTWIRLGDFTTPAEPFQYASTRTSDFMPGHLSAFAALTGDAAWTQLLDREYAMVASLQSQHAPLTGLLPDFVVEAATSPAPAPPGFLESPNDGSYYYNACRDPWRIGVHYLMTGDERARDALRLLNDWVRSATSDDPAKIAAGYHLDGTPVDGSDYLTMCFAAPFGVGAMSDGANQRWLNDVWDAVVAQASEGYYEDTLKLLAMIAMSGNWWAPDRE